MTSTKTRRADTVAHDASVPRGTFVEVQRTVMGLGVIRMLRVSEQIEAVSKATATPLRDTAFIIGPGIHCRKDSLIANS